MSKRSRNKRKDKSPEMPAENTNEGEEGISVDIDNNISRSSSSSPTSSHRDQHQNVEGSPSRDASFTQEVENNLRRNLPAVNVPEKIVLCIDTAEDPGKTTPFKLENGGEFSPFYMIKRIVEIFMHLKSTTNNQHEFALVALQSKTVTWIKDFTSDTKAIIQEVEKLNSTFETIKFDMTSLFNVLHKNIPMPKPVEDSTTQAPPFITRVILIYNRSNCVPEFVRENESYNYLTKCLYFNLDILYIHEEPSEDNKCEEIFNVLMDLSQQGISYFLNVQRNATKLHNNMAKLLAHPLQRPPQEIASYKVKV